MDYNDPCDFCYEAISEHSKTELISCQADIDAIEAQIEYEKSIMIVSDDDKMCICGHAAYEHHRSWFRGGGELIEECEAFGYNETGGMQNVNGRWTEHCQHFRLDMEARDGKTSPSRESNY